MASVSSFPTEFLDLYIKAAEDNVTLQLGSYKDAVRFRHRMHSLRAAMRRENHHLTHVAEVVTFKLSAVEGSDVNRGPWIVEASPADQHFVSAIREAGVEASEPPPPGQESLPPSPKGGPVDDPLADFMKKHTEK